MYGYPPQPMGVPMGYGPQPVVREKARGYGIAKVPWVQGKSRWVERFLQYGRRDLWQVMKRLVDRGAQTYEDH